MQIQRKLSYLFIIIALIFASLGIYYPWWSIKTSREVEIALQIAARANYGILQTVSTSKTIGNNTESILLSIQDLTKNDANRNSINSVFNIVITLTGLGIGFAILSLLLIIISTLRRLQRFALIGTFIAAILLIVAPLYFATTSYSLFANLDSVMPVDIPSTWAPLEPKSINSFWGSIAVPKTADFPTWLKDQTFWTWGAAFGWYLTFMAGVLLFVFALSIRHLS
jgi:hypothetical protein